MNFRCSCWFIASKCKNRRLSGDNKQYFIDDNVLFDDTNWKTEDKNYLQDLIQRTDFPEVWTIINVPENDVAQTTQRDPSPSLRC